MIPGDAEGIGETHRDLPRGSNRSDDGTDAFSGVSLHDFVAFLSGSDPGHVGPQIARKLDDPSNLVARLMDRFATPSTISEAEMSGVPARDSGGLAEDDDRNEAGTLDAPELLAMLREREATLPWVPRVDSPRRTSSAIRGLVPIAAGVCSLTVVAAFAFAFAFVRGREAGVYRTQLDMHEQGRAIAEHAIAERALALTAHEATQALLASERRERQALETQVTSERREKQALEAQVNALKADLIREKDGTSGREGPLLTLLDSEYQRLNRLTAQFAELSSRTLNDRRTLSLNSNRVGGADSEDRRLWATRPEPISPDALRVLLDATRYGGPEARGSALSVLCRVDSDNSRTVRLAEDLFRLDPVAAVRSKALVALKWMSRGAAGRSDYLSSLQKALNDPTDEVRRTALDLITPGELDSEELVPSLIGILQGGGDPSLRSLSASQLGMSSANGVGAALAKALEDDGNPEVRASAASSLGRAWGKGAAAAPLLRALRDREEQVRHAAALALRGHRKERDVAEGLLKVLSEDPGETARVSATSALDGSDDAGVINALAKALEDPAEAVRLAALSALRVSVDRKEVEVGLIRLVGNDQSEKVKVAAISALQMIPDEKVPIDPILLALGDPAERVRDAAGSLLAGLGKYERVASGLVKVLGEDRRDVARAKAASVIGKLPEDRLPIEPLIRALGDPAGLVRDAAATTLAKIDDLEKVVKESLVLIDRGGPGAPPDSAILLAVVKLLGSFGRRAEPALPRLDALRGAADPAVKAAATLAEKGILQDQYEAQSKAKEWAKAADTAVRLTEVDPRDIRAFAGLGDVRLKLERWVDAEDAYSRALSLDSKDAASWSGRARARSGLRRWETAVADYSESLAVKPKTASALTGRANASADLGRWKEAITDALEAVALADSNTFSFFSLAEICLRSGDIRGYRDACKASVERFWHPPNEVSEQVIDPVAWMCVLGPDSVADLKEVVRMAERNVERDRSHLFLQTLGAAYYRAGRWADAVKVYREGVVLEPNGGDVYDALFLAMALARHGRLEEARRWMAYAAARREVDVMDDRNPGVDVREAAEPVQRVLRREAEAVLAEAIEAIFANPFAPPT